ncbi:hypothetical protein RFI_08970 [Reticulomyxa filosa]|uniref:Helicase C-terminal domain-containing protein n=1 Tax=Reticulomyxa filosa TaxID=46433 RepID=X6NR17_RETFI|nr:hypothetical protein RFI_08970 [Reticulomyxa filosa]|eukprot:ETO28164.1 hypothetical protein RFI_08970 [Reticulomyxa filosa]
MKNQFLQRQTINAKAIHGDKSQAARDKIMNEFRHNKTRILIATDVVARGIDVQDIDVVLVYDFPNNVEDYVHRIGRTARGAKSGVALAYLKRGDIEMCGNALASVLAKSGQTIPPFLERH